MVGDFMDQRFSNLPAQSDGIAAFSDEWPIEKRDPIGQQKTVVAISILERRTFVKAEERIVARAKAELFEQLHTRLVVNDHLDVGETTGNMLWQLVHRLCHESPEAMPIHPVSIPILDVRHYLDHDR